MTVARGSIIAVWLAGMLGCAVLIGRAEFTADISAFLPRSPTPAQQLLVEQLRHGAVSRLVLLAIEGAPPDMLVRLSKSLASRLRNDTAFASIGNGEDAGLEKDREFLWRNRYLLSSAVTPERFSPSGLRQALENDLQLLASPAAMLVKQSLPGDPTGEILHLVEELESASRPVSRNGVWFSRDGKRALLIVQTRAAGFDIDAQQQALQAIRDAFAAAKQAMDGAQGARLLATGPGVFSVATRQRIEEDAWHFSMIAAGLVAGLLLLVYRSPRLLALAMLPVASGALAGIAAVSLGFGAVHGITLGFGVTLIGEAVDYAIYLFTQTAPDSPPHDALTRIWPTLRLGVLTSVFGFSAMLLSSFAGLAQLGLFSIVGLIVAVGVTRWVLPAMLPGNFSLGRPMVLAPAIMRLIERAPELRHPLLLALLLVVVAIGWRGGSLWDDRLSSLSPIPRHDRILDEELRRDLGAPDPRYMLVVTAPSEEQALQASEEIAARLREFVRKGALGGFDSPARYLPSEAAQRARQAALPEPQVLRANLQEALTGLPFRPDLFEPFLKDAAAARSQPLLDRESLQGTALSLDLAALLFRDNDHWTAMLPLRDVTDIQHLSRGIAAPDPAHAVLLDLKGESDRLYRTYRHQALMLSLLGGAAITLLLLASLRSPRRVHDVLAPLAAAVIMTAALLTVGDRRLSIFNLVGLLLVVGVGSNYALFFERRSVCDRHRDRTVTSLALANLCTVIGFGVLSLSRIPVLEGIGMTVAIGAALSLCFSAILARRAGSGGR